MNKCPYCGSENVILVANIEVHAKVDKDLNVEVSSYYKEWNTLEHIIKRTSCHNFLGECSDCKKSFEFDFDSGFVKDAD